MPRSKHGGKTKQEHTIIQGAERFCSSLALLPGVERVIPSVIRAHKAHGPPSAHVTRETASGMKLIVKSKGLSQDVFLVLDSGADREKIQRIIDGMESA